jgi:hypothetical protein
MDEVATKEELRPVKKQLVSFRTHHTVLPLTVHSETTQTVWRRYA